MIIRLLSEPDFPELLALEEQTSIVPWTRAAFQRCWEANYPGWVLIQAGKIIGFVLMSINAGECHLLNICIHPDFQKQGLGENLLRFAMTWARQQGAGIVYLEVRRSNTKAINLYRKMNFKQIGERKNYYPTKTGSENALIFAKDVGFDDVTEAEWDFPWEQQ